MNKARRLYRCVHCDVRIFRVSDKLWLKSLCMRTGRDVRLMLVHKPK